MTTKRYNPECMDRHFIALGKEGEGNHLALRFDTAVWREAYPEAEILMWVTPPKGDGYFAPLDEQSGDVIWTVTSGDTEHEGNGEIELILRDKATGTTIKSATARTLIKKSPSHGKGGNPPEAHNPWWEKVLAAIRGVVRSVNGVLPDEDGNVVIEVGGSLPSVSAPHQMLVTDADGNTVWEERTHYEADVTMLKETTVRTVKNDEMGGLCLAELPISMQGFEGYEGAYAVFNGEKYPAKDAAFIGNLVFMGDADTGEPFLIVSDVIVTATEMEATVSIYKKELRPLDNKFIANSIPKYGTTGEVYTIEWDGNTDGLDTFTSNGFPYYKVSDLVVPFEHVVTAKTRDNKGNKVTECIECSNCYALRKAYVITQAGKCVNEHDQGFTAPSTGVYFQKYDYTTGTEWTEYAEIDTRRENSILYLTNPSGVKYAITVDDSGALDTNIVSDR